MTLDETFDVVVLGRLRQHGVGLSLRPRLACAL